MGQAKQLLINNLYGSAFNDNFKIILPSDQPGKLLDKSTIFSKDGILGISGADSTFVAANEILPQSNYSKRDGLLMKSMENSKMSFSEMSESINLEAEGEGIFNENDEYERVRVRNIP